MSLKYQLKQYRFALLVAAFFYIIFSLYLFFRWGYFDLYIANKAFANLTAFLLALVLLIGPGSRLFSSLRRFVQYRKALGISVFFLALIHGVISFFFLPSKFPLSRFLGRVNLPFIFGLSAIIILFILFITSFKSMVEKIGRNRWWKLQYQGARMAFIFIALHVIIMKLKNWLHWYQIGGGKKLENPHLPGLGLLITWLMIFVILIRIAEYIHPKLGKIVWYFSFFALTLIYLFTFWLGKIN